MFEFRDMNNNKITAEIVVPYETDSSNTANIIKSVKKEYRRLELSSNVYTYKRLADEGGAFVGLRLYMDGRMFDVHYCYSKNLKSKFPDKKPLPLKECILEYGTIREKRLMSHLERCMFKPNILCVSHIVNTQQEANELVKRFFNCTVVKADDWNEYIKNINLNNVHAVTPVSFATTMKSSNKKGTFYSTNVKNTNTDMSTIESPVSKKGNTDTSTVESPVSKKVDTDTSTNESPVAFRGCGVDANLLKDILTNTEGSLANDRTICGLFDSHFKSLQTYIDEREGVLSNERLELFSILQSHRQAVVEDIQSYIDQRLVQERGYTQTLFLQLMEAINNINVKTKFSNDFYPMPPALADLIVAHMGSGSRTCANDCKKAISEEPMYSIFVTWVREANSVKSSKISEDILTTDNRRLKEWYTILTTRPRQDVVR